jgi:peptide-methionine (S)-S-oxide reductase
VGFAGGNKPNPTYYDLGDHSETIEIDYDPAVISYEDLLGQFWAQHDASRPAFSRQYRSAIFYRDEAQKAAAEASRAAWEKRIGGRVSTALEPAGAFYRAEDYHQKYYLTHDALLMSELRSIYPDIRDFTDSTAVARLQGLVGGHGLPHEAWGEAGQARGDGSGKDAPGKAGAVDPGLSESELKALGLSPEATEHVRDLLKTARPPIRCGG